VLERFYPTVATSCGDVRIKLGKRTGTVVTASPEN